MISPLVMHAGTSTWVSQLVLTLMFVVLGLLMVGIGFGFLMKSKEGLLEHRWILSVSVALTLGAVFFVMLPTAFRFYADPDVEVFSSLSITTIIHAIIGFPALVTAIIYAFGDLPQKARKWMRITAALWLAALAFGIVLFLQMMSTA